MSRGWWDPMCALSILGAGGSWRLGVGGGSDESREEIIAAPWLPRGCRQGGTQTWATWDMLWTNRTLSRIGSWK